MARFPFLILPLSLFALAAPPARALDSEHTPPPAREPAPGLYARLAGGLQSASHAHIDTAVRGAALGRDLEAPTPRSRAILGLQIPLLVKLDLFAEGRASLGLLPAGELSGLFARELEPAVAGLAGLRLSF